MSGLEENTKQGDTSVRKRRVRQASSGRKSSTLPLSFVTARRGVYSRGPSKHEDRGKIYDGSNRAKLFQCGKTLGEKLAVWCLCKSKSNAFDEDHAGTKLASLIQHGPLDGTACQHSLAAKNARRVFQ